MSTAALAVAVALALLSLWRIGSGLYAVAFQLTWSNARREEDREAREELARALHPEES